MSGELAKLQAGFASLSKQMQMAQINTAHPDNIKTYNDQLLAVNRLRDGYTKMKDGVATYMPGLNEMMQATGMMTVETVKSMSATQSFTKALTDHKVGLGSVITNYGQFRAQLRAATQEQANLQKGASAIQWTNGGVGNKNAIDLYVPKNIGNALVDAHTKYGMINYSIQQIATNTVNWGKNTQWAGRQLTAGISMPLALAAAQIVSLAKETDQALTRITKVYNTQTVPGASPEQQQISNTKQLAEVRQQSYATGIQMAQQYGASLQETLATEADLAAIGKTGNELMQSTAQVTRIATLGELDHNTAMQMSISLMSAFKMNASQMGDAFNYINAIENATSLTTQDFAEAIPRAGAAVAATGVTLQQFGILMTAMKEGGVNADQGANALKSAMSRILTPTAAARKEFGDMKINIDQVVGEAKGNLFVVLEELGKKMQGFNEIQKQTALKDLFGTYQVNRLDVALNGVSESLAGVSTEFSQTAMAAKVAGEGSASWANTADNEIKQLNDSISMKFKKAIETLKAEFAAAGMPILKVITSILNGVGAIVDAFNNSPSWVKNIVGWGAAAVAIVGPIIMIVGLFANWIGSIIKLGTGLGGLLTKFQPMTAEQKANEAITRLAAQSYDIQAQSAAILAQKIAALTTAMLQNQKAQAAMMGTQAAASQNPLLTAMAQSAATATTPSGNEAVDTYGSHAAPVAAEGEGQAAAKNASAVNEAVAKSAEEAAKASEGMKTAVEENSAALAEGEDPLKTYNERTYDLGDATEHAAVKGREAGATFRMVFSTLTAASVGIMGLKELTSGTADWGTAILNVSLILGALEAGGVFKGLKNGIKALADDTVGLGSVAGKFRSIWTAAIGAVGTAFRALRTVMSFMFTTPWGIALTAILAIGTAVYFLTRNMHEMENNQNALNDETSKWAEILGFTEEKISLTDKSMQSLATHAAAVSQEVAKLPQNIKDAYAASGSVGDGFETLYNDALLGSLKSLSSGATIAQARKQLEIALNAGNADPTHIKEFLVRFDNLQLDNPENVHSQLKELISKALEGAGQGAEENIVSSQQSNWFAAAWDGHFGNAATDSARAAASKAAKAMTTAFYDAMKENNIDGEKEATDAMKEGLNSMFEDTFNSIKDDKLFKELGVKTMDDLYHVWDDAVRNGAKRGSPAATLTREVANDPEMEDALNAYGEMWDKMLDQVGGAMGKSGDQLDEWKSHMHTWEQVVGSMGGPLETVEQAQTNYNKALDDYKAKNAGKEMPEDLKLAALNAERLKLGLAPTTNLLDMFTVAADGAGNAADGAARAFKTMADALDTTWAMDNMAGSDYANMMKDAMSGAADYVFQTAQKGAERAEKAKEKAIQDGGQRQVDALKKQEKAVQAQYDADSKALQDKNDADKKAIEDKYKALADMYDKDIKQAEDAAKAKTDALNDEIKALQKDDEARQKLFQNETNRIERLAQMQNSSIDFNSAMNSGNIDEAAKIMNNASAQQTGWMLQDQQAKMDDASKAQQDNLQAQIDAINAAKDAYVQAEQDKKAALDDQKQAELDAIDKVYQANKTALDKKKQDDLDALQASEDAVQKDTQNRLASQQQWYQDNIDKVNLELETLKASVPKNAAEVQTLADNVRAKYKALGIDLENVSGAWTGDLGVAIAQNIDRARLSAADGQAWQQVGKFIADQISAGSGFSIDQVLTYLRTGAWPDAPAGGAGGAPKPTPNASLQGYTNGDWIGAFLNQALGKSPTPSGNPAPTSSNLPGLPPVRHGGGILGGDGINSRGNIPWSAPLQPSETFALLQHGEFVVNKDAAAQNMDLLTAINSGMKVRHGGGPIGLGLAGGIGLAVTQAMLLQGTLMEAAMVKGLYQKALQQWAMQTLNPANWLTGKVAPAPVDVSGNKKIVMDLAAQKYGWQGAEWDSLYQLIMHESGFKNTAQNPTSTAYGMFQFLDGTWGGYGVKKTSDPSQQAIAGLAYIKARYGDPIHAWNMWQSRSPHWYDNGGYLQPGATMTMNGTGRPEPVFTADQWNILSSLVAKSANNEHAMGPLSQAITELKASIDSGNNNNYTVNVDMTGANINSSVDMEKAVYKALVKIDNKNGRSRTIG